MAKILFVAADDMALVNAALAVAQARRYPEAVIEGAVLGAGTDEYHADLLIALGAPPSAGWPDAPAVAPLLRWPLTAADPEGRTQELAARWTALIDSGALDTLVKARADMAWLLDCLPDAVLAHDARRRLVYANRATERLVGMDRQAMLGQDCHRLFPGHLCGGQCLFQDAATMPLTQRADEFDIARPDGERRRVTCRAHRRTPDNDGLLLTLKDISLEHELARQARAAPAFAGIVGSDPRMREVFEMIRDLADTTAPVLIQGESGTGKELVAAAIHAQGVRAARPFVAVNCGALPETLLESELFGHVRGAFTGAIRDKKGRFELADGGTIFLDEVGDIAPAVQVKLLRVLQEGRFERVGDERTIRVDVRVISATNKVLTQEIAAGRFREDLFYRLSVVPLLLPALRERRGDIPALARHLLDRLTDQLGASPVALSPSALDALMAHGWPGNVREMQNWLQYALVRSHGQTIEPRHFPPTLAPAPASAWTPSRQGRLTTASVKAALAACQGNRQAAARHLGVSRATLYRFLDRQRESDGAGPSG